VRSSPSNSKGPVSFQITSLHSAALAATRAACETRHFSLSVIKSDTTLLRFAGSLSTAPGSSVASHPSTRSNFAASPAPPLGSASEAHWLKLFNSHLPERYRASSAFIVDSDGRRSRQIDIAIYDRFYSPLIFPYESGFLVPAESVHAIVEVKQVLTRQYMRDVGRKIASVRRLNRTSVRVPYAGGSYPPKKPHRILGVLAATRSVWGDDSFRSNLVSALAQLDDASAVDLMAYGRSLQSLT
jgi:hypothetical protein